eukprot:TRINITY_DN120183_c1_g1_i1.p1 TRINITY_DN120183_c1_g1~~TRINITY_DN120183_c1_g1_i1.p1  ORF type:complete len:773 (+),score=32.77 TRINITY_DN120183_c1_g1_i1:975-3293(+)
MGEFFYSTFALWLWAFKVVCNVLELASISETYDYILAFPLISLQLCIIRWFVEGQVKSAKPTRETQAIGLVKELVELSKNKTKENTTWLFFLLSAHRKECLRIDCVCRKLFSANFAENTNPITVNSRTYTTVHELPSMYYQEYTSKTIKLLVGELDQTFGKNNGFGILLAELYYYYLGNHYFTLEKLRAIRIRNPNLIVQQRIYNLKRNIGIGLLLSNNSSRDSGKTTAAVDYLKSYHKFLKQAEDLTESTIKFWSVLAKDQPTAMDLNQIGKSLFKSKQAITCTVQEISGVALNHSEFMIRYGLLLRFVIHDFVTAEQIFRKLTCLSGSSTHYPESNEFSLFSGNSKVMLLIATFGSAGTAMVTETNTAAERTLGYSCKEIVGYSVTRLMPSIVAQIHDKFVQRFFQTMETRNIGVPRLRFVKAKSGLYVPCKVLKKIVPRLHSGLQAAIFMIRNTRITQYLEHKKDHTVTKTGAVLCDAGHKIIGLTKEAIKVLKVTEQEVNDLLKNATLEDLFPQLSREDVRNALRQKEGRVIEFSLTRTDVGLSTDKIINPAEINTPALLWARLVTEEYTDTERIHILLLAEVNQERLGKYTPVEGYDGLFEDKTISELKHALRITTKPQKKKERAKFIDSTYITPEEQSAGNLSPSGSIASLENSVDSGSERSGSSSSDTNSQLQGHDIIGKTPTSIKRLLTGIILVLLGITALIRKQPINQQNDSCGNVHIYARDWIALRPLWSHTVLFGAVHYEHSSRNYGFNIPTYFGDHQDQV